MIKIKSFSSVDDFYKQKLLAVISMLVRHTIPDFVLLSKFLKVLILIVIPSFHSFRPVLCYYSKLNLTYPSDRDITKKNIILISYNTNY